MKGYCSEQGSAVQRLQSHSLARTDIPVQPIITVGTASLIRFFDRLYIFESDVMVAYKGGRGPFGILPQEMEQVVVMRVLDESRAGARLAESGSTD